MQPAVRQQLALHTAIRGWYGGRALLYKDSDGATKVDITPFDPLHTFYQMGVDGLKWVCYKVLKTREEIEEEFGVALSTSKGQASGSELGIPVLYWYDEENSAVAAEGQWVEPPKPHGAEHTPCFIGYVGPNAFIQRKDTADVKALMSEVGESIYAPLRDAYDILNKAMSDRWTYVARSIDPGSVIKSEKGDKKLDENPYAQKSQVSLKFGESLEPLQLQQMTRDSDLMVAQVLGDIQRGSFSHTTYGDTPPHQLSGIALSILQGGQGLRVQDQVLAMQNAYRQITSLLCEQYQSGSFSRVLAKGREGRSYYSEEVDPTSVGLADDLEIRLLPRLPKDEAGAYALAQIARGGPVPLLSDRTIRDDTLGLVDADGEDDLIKEQMAERATPMAVLMSMFEAAVKQGRQDLLLVYGQELQKLVAGAMMPQQETGPVMNGANGGSQPRQRGMPPEVLPPQMQGFRGARPVAAGAAPIDQNGTR